MGDITDMIFDMWGDPYDDELLECNDRVCNYCGEENLHWGKVGDKWRLFNDDGNQHICNFGVYINNNNPTGSRQAT